MLEMKKWRTIGFDWLVLRHEYNSWYYLFRNGLLVKESGNYQELLRIGWYR